MVHISRADSVTEHVRGVAYTATSSFLRRETRLRGLLESSTCICIRTVKLNKAQRAANRAAYGGEAVEALKYFITTLASIRIRQSKGPSKLPCSFSGS